MSIKITKKDVVWNYLGIFISMTSSFLILPFMMIYLDEDTLGLWYVFFSVGAIVNLFDFGFNPTLARNVAYCWSGAKELSKKGVIFTNSKEPNIPLLKKIIYTCKKIYLIISSVALVILLTIGTWYIVHISSNIKGDKHIIAWYIYSFAVFLNLYYGYYTTFLRGVGGVAQINKASIISKIFQIIISILLLKFGASLIGASLAYIFSAVVFRVISKKSFYSYNSIGEKLKDDKTVLTIEDFKYTFSLIWDNAWKDGLVSLSAYLSNQANTFICSMYLSLSETGIYSISMQLITAIVTISGSLYTAYQPAIQSAYVLNDKYRLRKLMSTAITVYYALFFIGIIGLLIVGIPILTIIKPEMKFNIPMLIFIGIYMFLLKHHCCYASYISNTNYVPYTNSFLISSIIATILSFIAIKFTFLGVWGLIIPPLIVQAVYNNWIWPHKVLKSLDINLIESIKIGINELRNLINIKRFI